MDEKIDYTKELRPPQSANRNGGKPARMTYAGTVVRPAGDPYRHLILAGAENTPRYCDDFGFALVDGKRTAVVVPPPPPAPPTPPVATMADVVQKLKDLDDTATLSSDDIREALRMIHVAITELPCRIAEAVGAAFQAFKVAAEWEQQNEAIAAVLPDVAAAVRREPAPAAVEEVRATVRNLRDLGEATGRPLSAAQEQQIEKAESEELRASLRRIATQPEVTKVIVGTSNLTRKKSGVVGAVNIVTDMPTQNGLHVRGLDPYRVVNVYVYATDEASRVQIRSYIAANLTEEALRK